MSRNPKVFTETEIELGHVEAQKAAERLIAELRAEDAAAQAALVAQGFQLPMEQLEKLARDRDERIRRTLRDGLVLLTTSVDVAH